MDEEQFSQTLPFSSLLALSGGFMDAYSYMGHGQVFANAQTGNILLLGIHLCAGDFDLVLHYLIPILCFVGGIAVCECLHLRKHRHLHWKQHTLVAEALILAAVSRIPGDLAANSLISLACGMQVQAFQKLHGRPVATTMCIGNIRNGTNWLMKGIQSRNREDFRISFLYFYVILCFACGAIMGNIMLHAVGLSSILVCSTLLLFSCLLIQFQRK